MMDARGIEKPIKIPWDIVCRGLSTPLRQLDLDAQDTEGDLALKAKMREAMQILSEV